jgi:hypothetical protein
VWVGLCVGVWLWVGECGVVCVSVQVYECLVLVYEP